MAGRGGKMYENNAPRKLVINLWTMGSDPGYRPSGGFGRAILAKPKEVDTLRGNHLFEFADKLWRDEPSRRVSENHLGDIAPWEKHPGVLNYTGKKGTFTVSEGFIVVEFELHDVCTNDKVHTSAKILNPEDLKDYYRERAEHYARLAEEK